jgi:hypothetical protein
MSEKFGKKAFVMGKAVKDAGDKKINIRPLRIASTKEGKFIRY